MASKFKIGDLVWAKMKGFPPWPGKVIEPKSDTKTQYKAKKHFVFFYGSENYAWIPDDNIWSFRENKERFVLTQRVPKGFKEAVEAIEDVFKNMPQAPVKAPQLPSIDDEIKEIFHDDDGSKKGKDRIRKDYTREPYSGKGKRPSKDKVAEKTPGPKTEETNQEKTSLTDKKSTPKSITKVKKRPATPHPSGTPHTKKSKHIVKAPVSSKHNDISSPLTNSTAPKSYINHERSTPSASTITASASSTSQPKESRTSMIGQAFVKESPVFERYDRHLDPSMVEPILTKSIIPTPLKIGFLGLGIMGSGMVANLLRSGHEVTIWNRTPSKCREFVKEGALKGNSPAEVVQQCDITLSSVADPTALKDLVFGNCGVLQGISQGKAYVDLSTVDVETITDVHEAVTARGGRFLEAPVIGSKQPASNGSLLVLAAGDRSLYDDCYSCFEAMGKRTFYLGEIGCAAKMKLVLNLFMGTVIAGLAESLALAEKVGLDQEGVLQILDLSPVACPLVKTKGLAMIMSNYSDPNCKLQSYQKDLRLAVNLSDTVDQPLHVGSAVNELFKKAKAKGYGEHDTAAVYRAADL